MPKNGYVTQQEIDAAADKHGVDRGLFRRLIKQESGGKVKIGSPAGARGPGQLMPGTARGLGVNPEDPLQNLDGSARYLRQQIDHFKGNVRLGVAAYNAGAGNVEKYGGVPPFAETQKYVKIVYGDGSMSQKGRDAGARAGRPKQQPAQEVDRAALAQQLIGSNNGAPSAAATSDPLGIGVVDRLHRGDMLGLAMDVKAQRDQQLLAQAMQAPTATTVPRRDAPTPAPSKHGHNPAGVKITGPNPGRIKPQVKDFLGDIARLTGSEVVGSDGTGHSRLTVNGRVSQHTTGNASDVPARGTRLIHLGQAALIAAGMPEAQARKQTGGLFNVSYKGRRTQVIFNTHEGGDHTDHLHVGVA